MKDHPDQGSAAWAFQQAVESTKINIAWRNANEANIVGWLELKAMWDRFYVSYIVLFMERVNQEEADALYAWRISATSLLFYCLFSHWYTIIVVQ